MEEAVATARKLKRIRKVRLESNEVDHAANSGNAAEGGSGADSKSPMAMAEHSDCGSVQRIAKSPQKQDSPESAKKQSKSHQKQKRARKNSKRQPEQGTSSLELENRRPKKRTKREVEEMHAESQRLLRETKDVSFQPTPVRHVPISGLLAKLRARKAQLGWKCKPRDDPADRAKPEDVPDAQVPEESLATDNQQVSSPSSSYHEPAQTSTNILRQALDNTQDLFGDSQPIDDLLHQLRGDGGPVPDAPSMDLHLGTEPQTLEPNLMDEDEVLEEDDVVEAPSMDFHMETDTQAPDFGRSKVQADINRLVRGYQTKPQVAALVDCEAEVEDEDDVLARDSDEEEEDGADVLEIIEPAKPEVAADISKRADLHRQWLEYQDEAETDNLLAKLMKKTPATENDAFTADVDEDKETNTRTSGRKTSKVEYDTYILEAFVEENVPEVEHEPSDDEETEREILRQRVIAVSEEQEEFTFSVDDESSRKMLSFIKKMNVAPATKNKQDTRKPIPGICKTKPVFSNRVVSSASKYTSVSLNSCASRSRSFIFRDESNSRSQGSDANVAARAKCVTPPSSNVTVNAGATTSTNGPSLFSILRQQAGQPTQPPDKSISDRISMFARKVTSKRSMPKPAKAYI